MIPTEEQTRHKDPDMNLCPKELFKGGYQKLYSETQELIVHVWRREKKKL
jgi:hypothetical protein